MITSRGFADGVDFVNFNFLLCRVMLRNGNSTKPTLSQNRCCHIGFLAIFFGRNRLALKHYVGNTNKIRIIKK